MLGYLRCLHVRLRHPCSTDCPAKSNDRTVYLPAGASWTLANTGDVYEGGKAYEIEAPIETLPIFLRNGKQGYLVGEI